MKKENKLNYDNLISLLLELENGEYTVNDSKVRIIDNDQNKLNQDKIAIIENKSIKIDFSIYNNTEYSISIEDKNNNYNLHISNSNYRPQQRFLYTTINGIEYIVRSYQISKKDSSICVINDNEIINKIDNLTKIGLDLENLNIYIYLKNPYSNLNNKADYLKIKYDVNFILKKDKYNKKVFEFINKLTSQLKGTPLEEMVNNLDIEPIKKDFTKEIKNLKELAKIYLYYNKELSEFENNKLFQEAYKCVEKLVNDPYKAHENRLNNYMKKANLNNKYDLKYIKKELRKLKKEKKKNKSLNMKLK